MIIRIGKYLGEEVRFFEDGGRRFCVARDLIELLNCNTIDEVCDLFPGKVRIVERSMIKENTYPVLHIPRRGRRTIELKGILYYNFDGYSD